MKWTPLHVACSLRMVDVVSMLLKHGASVDMKLRDSANSTPWDVIHGDVDGIQRLLLEYGYEPDE